ncbi:phasin [Rhizobium sp. YTU87027]|uniref:phasin n=1 Tax=Rhizobium sp. YTU87027 TaxID=3417741 RepID=UPI003D68C353
MANIKMDDVFSMSSFDPSKFTESFRDFAEKGAQQSREAYAKMKTAGEEASKTLEATVQTAQAGAVEIGHKAIDALRTNAENSLTHMEALLAVKSVAELVELQTTFLRKQVELTIEQAKTMQETSKQVAEKLAKPSKEAAEKVMASFKAA